MEVNLISLSLQLLDLMQEHSPLRIPNGNMHKLPHTLHGTEEVLMISTMNCLLHAPDVCRVLKSSQQEGGTLPPPQGHCLEYRSVAPEGAWVCQKHLPVDRKRNAYGKHPTWIPPASVYPVCHTNSVMLCVLYNVETLGK